LDQKVILLSKKDNVAVAITPLHRGDNIQLDGMKVPVPVEEDIDFGHKIALVNIKKGQDIIKYGEIIGLATQDIPAGRLVHIHNIKSLRAGKND
jgi:altronate dehydratase small subunit